MTFLFFFKGDDFFLYLFKGDDFFYIYSRVMTGEELVHIDDESEAAREEERFWKSMYFRWDRICTLGEIVVSSVESSFADDAFFSMRAVSWMLAREP